MRSIPGRRGPTLEEDIKHEARRLGFILAGVTTPEPPAHLSAFESWLSLGRHGQMGYLATERSRLCRADPRKILPGCRSILVLAMPYSNPAADPPAESLARPAGARAKVAAYAWGQDYHEVITGRLHALLAFIGERAARAVSSRCYTDTGPILERDLAQRAGLGWIGRNTCLINPKLGSYFLLAEILLDLELLPDSAFQTDHCGSCTRCIRSCPTDCILTDRTIDARRCISYLTIELKDQIPLELRPQMGGWIFGCDICQMVCPWNRFAPAQGESALTGDFSADGSSIVEQLSLTADEFARRVRASPIKRSKYRGYLRNAAVAAGNIGEAEVTQLLQELAENSDPILREHAVWALAHLAERSDRHA